MESSRPIMLVDDRGQPLSPHLADVLTGLVPKFRRTFHCLSDDYTLVEIFEDAARKIEGRERRSGPLERLHAYAWVTVRSVATSRLRRNDYRLLAISIRSQEGEAILAHTPSREGGAHDIERCILARQLLSAMRPAERVACIAKAQGFSSQEIANRLGTSVTAVDKMVSRTRQRLCDRLDANPLSLDRTRRSGGRGVVLPRLPVPLGDAASGVTVAERPIRRSPPPNLSGA